MTREFQKEHNSKPITHKERHDRHHMDAFEQAHRLAHGTLINHPTIEGEATIVLGAKIQHPMRSEKQ